ncbi:hypothetical protein AAHE18_02G025000 [Arachis hypogaea]
MDFLIELLGRTVASFPTLDEPLTPSSLKLSLGDCAEIYSIEECDAEVSLESQLYQLDYSSEKAHKGQWDTVMMLYCILDGCQVNLPRIIRNCIKNAWNADNLPFPSLVMRLIQLANIRPEANEGGYIVIFGQDLIPTVPELMSGVHHSFCV